MVDLVARQAPDVVFHLAGRPDPQVAVEQPARDAATTIVGTLHLLEGARRGGVSKVIFASTCKIYGAVEAADLPVRESHPQQPRSPAAVAKKAVTDYLIAYRDLYDLEFTSLALATVYGPRQDPAHGSWRRGELCQPSAGRRRMRDPR